MKEIESRLISIGATGIRMQVRWKAPWFSRWFMDVLEISAVYHGSGTVWHVVPSFERCSTPMEAKLADIATRLINEQSH